MPGIVYGVCGIGNGHAHRQLPVVRALARDHLVALLTYGEASATFVQEYGTLPNLRVFPVSVPRLPGGPHGLDWSAAAERAIGSDPWATNGRTLAALDELVGKPDLVVSDYEQTAASYAYATRAPLVTFDQQSKFLVGDIPRIGPGGRFGADDEIARLRMFVPKTEIRLACSFFPVSRLPVPHKEVEIVAPVISDEILRMKRAPSERHAVLVYLSPEAPGGGNPETLLTAAARHADCDFHVYCQPSASARETPRNLFLHAHGDEAFIPLMGSAHGLICTAGHSLLSEAVHVGIPAMAIPLALHEQHVNAAMLAASGGSLAVDGLDVTSIEDFVSRLPELEAGQSGRTASLMRGTSASPILVRLRQWLPYSPSAPIPESPE
jgi:uncharacterized protein (TIGR00661 family)